MSLAPIPPHVPPERVRDFDFLDMRDETDVHRWFKRLHRGPDIFYTPRHGGHWVVTRYADMEAILRNDADFSSRHSSLPREGKPMRLTLLESDEPIHGDFRRLVQPFFSPGRVAELERKARRITIELIEGFRPRGSCEFVSDFALRMPIGIFLGLVDLPDTDREYLIGIALNLVRSKTPEAQIGAFGEAFAYLGRQFADRRAHPRGDLLSAIMKGTVEGGRPVTEQELLGLGALLLAAGLDTVANLLGFTMNFLARSPAHRAQILANRDRIPAMVDELARRFHVVNIARIASRDLDFNGLGFRKDEAVLIPTVLAGLDDRQFRDPMTVDFDRADKRSLIFGRGVHQCIGMFLARAEMKVFLEEWFARIPHFSIEAGKEPVFASGRASGASYLPLTWAPG